jgi:hypothetical protein
MTNRIWKVLFSFLCLLPGRAHPATESTPGSIEILCGTAVGLRFQSEVNLPDVTDKYRHCALSCVITLYCGPIESLETGILKEVMDSLGWGAPDLEDLRADWHGIRAALRFRGRMSRRDCYRACSAGYPASRATPGTAPSRGG